jgi:triosephosphate isomerase (TIM)
MSLIIANWKMNLCNNIHKLSLPENIQLIIAPPFTHISALNNIAKLCAQDVSKFDHKNGAYTGEISADILNEIGCSYCIVGHSERRIYSNETAKDIAKKIQNLNHYNITPIICIGEDIDTKKNGNTIDFLINELEVILQDTVSENNFIIAYEPVWAIGSGTVATNNEIKLISETLSAYLLKKFDKKIQIVYGGSVNKDSINDILKINDIDGVLIGGACLDIDKFNEILKMVEKI